jgi:hypothetical protein
MVYLPKDEGGLWVLDFKKQNESLLMHKFYNRLDVKLIWQKYYSSGQLQVSISGGGTYLSCYPPSKAQILKHPSQIIRFFSQLFCTWMPRGPYLSKPSLCLTKPKPNSSRPESPLFRFRSLLSLVSLCASSWRRCTTNDSKLI